MSLGNIAKKVKVEDSTNTFTTSACLQMSDIPEYH